RRDRARDPRNSRRGQTDRVRAGRAGTDERPRGRALARSQPQHHILAAAARTRGVRGSREEGEAMSGPGPETRALLEAARDGLSPSPAAIHRVRAKVGASAAAGTAAGATLAVKLGLVVIVATSAVGAGVYASKRGPEPEVPRVE